MKQTIAQNMVEIMKKHNREYVWYGDIDLIEECAKISKLHSTHPKKRIQYVLNALERSPHFIKNYIKIDVNGKNRKYRCFKLVV